MDVRRYRFEKVGKIEIRPMHIKKDNKKYGMKNENLSRLFNCKCWLMPIIILHVRINWIVWASCRNLFGFYACNGNVEWSGVVRICWKQFIHYLLGVIFSTPFFSFASRWPLELIILAEEIPIIFSGILKLYIYVCERVLPLYDYVRGMYNGRIQV